MRGKPDTDMGVHTMPTAEALLEALTSSSLSFSAELESSKSEIIDFLTFYLGGSDDSADRSGLSASIAGYLVDNELVTDSSTESVAEVIETVLEDESGDEEPKSNLSNEEMDYLNDFLSH